MDFEELKNHAEMQKTQDSMLKNFGFGLIMFSFLSCGILYGFRIQDDAILIDNLKVEYVMKACDLKKDVANDVADYFQNVSNMYESGHITFKDAEKMKSVEALYDFVKENSEVDKSLKNLDNEINKAERLKKDKVFSMVFSFLAGSGLGANMLINAIRKNRSKKQQDNAIDDVNELL